MTALKKSLITLAIILMLVGGLTYSMLSLAEVECSLCIHFKGQVVCETAFGPDRDAAIEEAHRAACAQVASGVTDALACNRAVQTDLSCNQ